MYVSPSHRVRRELRTESIADSFLGFIKLLGFTLPARLPQSNVVGSPRRSNRRNAGHGVYDKQKFVNAQMRFVLKPTGG